MTTRIFLDLDGTVYLSGEIIAQVDVQLRRVTDEGALVYYMTNNTSMSSDEYAKKLAKLGLPLSERSIISPTKVLCDWLRSQKIQNVYAVGTKTFCQELEEAAGVCLTSEAPECVIVGFDRELDYDKLQTACGLINAGVPWYQTHIDLACPSPAGPIPDCGAIAKLIEATTGIASKGHFGKPGPRMIQFVSAEIEDGDPVVVAGDRLYTDAEVGLTLGARTILVCTGEFQRGASQIDPRIEVYDTLAGFLKAEL